MKITIDTKEDSHEELRKVIKMLSSLVGEKEVMSNRDVFSDENNSDDNKDDESPNMFNMFDSSNPETKSEKNSDEDKKEEIENDLGIPQVEEYD